MDAPNRQIPSERKAMYYGGLALVGVGLLLFLSVFVTFTANFGNFDNFESRGQSEGFRALGGIILIILGNFLRIVGARGWAGSGVVLDPEKARKDVEPWSRMGGGIVQDALSEVDVVKKLENKLEPSHPVIKVRCKSCQALNDETAKFCNACGKPI